MQRNQFGLNRTLGAAIGVVAAVALGGSLFVSRALDDLSDALATRYRSTQVVADIGAWRTAMVDQETGIRGYLLTGRPSSLEPYQRGQPAMAGAVARLERAIPAAGDQHALLDQAERASQAWQATIGQPVVRLMDDPTGRERARTLEATGEGKQLFDTFRARLAAMEARERQTLEQQNRILRRNQRLAFTILWATSVATLLICLGAGLALGRLVTRPLVGLANAMTRLVQRDTDVTVPGLQQRSEVGAMARAVEVFRMSLIELDRTSVLRATADVLPALVAYIGADRRVGFLNGTFADWFALEGGDVAQGHGRAVEQVFAAGTFPGGLPNLDRVLRGEELRFALQLIRGEDSARRDMEADFRPHRAADGRVLGAVILFTDVTDRKGIDRRLRHQAHDLQRSNEELEQFAYVASHDLKAPLRGIENLANWIEEDLGDTLSGEPATNMGLLKSRIRRLESLLTDLLAYSRAGRTDNVVKEVDTRALVEELAVLIAPPEGFEVAADPGLPTFRAVQAALAQVLQNLIGNAVKHHPDPVHGHVWVRAERASEQWAFEVADDGPGVPVQFRDRVFGMFQTLRPRDEVEGSGMGLAIVRKLIERQGGKVWLSERPAGGLVVHFTWPAVPGEI